MFEIVRTLYKELHYQMLKRDPRLSEEKMLKALNRISVKRNVVKISFLYLFFGSFLASGIVFTDEKIVISSLAVTIATLSFVFALYATVVNSSHSLSIGLFEPLKVLPVRIGAVYLSELLMLDIIPTLAITIPTVAVVTVKYPLSGILLFLWTLVGIFIGHTIGLLVLSTFGLRVSYRKTKGQLLRNLIRIFGLIVIMSAFYALNYFQRYLMQYSERFADVFEKYALAYPFSVSSIFEPERSSILLVAYAFVFLLLYRFSINRVWKGVLEPKMVVESRPKSFSVGFGGPILALAIKDLRLVFRKTSMIAGLLIPLYFILPQIFMVVRDGNFPKELVIGMIAVVSFFSTINADILLRVEGKEIDFLRILPVKKSQFILGKAISMSVLPVVFSVALVCLGFYFDRIALIFLPHAFLMPFDVSLLSMIYLFHYKGEEIGIPEKNLLNTIVTLAINGIFVGTITLPLFLISFPIGFAISLLIAVVSFVVMLWRIRK
ncbi:MAG: hypothetical protein H0Z28_11395 [Archaeoglobus sp.]|nr:hypothetical protein [Archaeoglobus sp.]